MTNCEGCEGLICSSESVATCRLPGPDCGAIWDGRIPETDIGAKSSDVADIFWLFGGATCTELETLTGELEPGSLGKGELGLLDKDLLAALVTFRSTEIIIITS